MKRRMLLGLCLLCVALAVSSASGAEATFRVAVPAKPAAPAAKPGPAATAPDAAAHTPDDSTSALIQEVKQNRRRLTTAVISAPEAATAQSQLREAIERVRSISLKPPTPVEDTGGQKKEKKPDAGPPTEAEPPAPRILTPERLAKLKEQLEKAGADGFADPASLADALFRSGHPDHAYALYERLLADKTTDDSVKAWLLFQMANCKRPSDAVTAATLYGRLLSEHGKSPWVDASKAYKTLLEWRQTVNPEAILKAIYPPSPEPTAKGQAEWQSRTVESDLADAVVLPIGGEVKGKAE
jgi:hypothetical protein